MGGLALVERYDGEYGSPEHQKYLVTKGITDRLEAIERQTGKTAAQVAKEIVDGLE
jgi:hypothetical protein